MIIDLTKQIKGAGQTANTIKVMIEDGKKKRKIISIGVNP